MPLLTTNHDIPYPEASDAADVPADMELLAERLEDLVTPYSSGTIAARPAFGIVGRRYRATDTGRHYVDIGSAWVEEIVSTDSRLSDERIPPDGSVTAAKIVAALKPSGSAAAGTEALRALGVTAATAAAGNDARLPNQDENDALQGSSGTPGNANRFVTNADSRNSDQRVPTDGSVTAGKVAASLKPSGGAGVGTESLRKLGTGAGDATAGDDARIPTQNQNNALDGTNGAPSDVNKFVTDSDPRVPTQAENDALAGSSGSPSGSNKYVTDADSRLTAVPTAVIVQTVASSAPAGWLLCQGQAVSRTTYAALFAVVGITYGTGDGTTTFNLPDLRGRVPVGVGTHADVNALGDNDGAALASRTPEHTHTVPTGGPSSQQGLNTGPGGFNVASNSHTHGTPTSSSNGPSFIAVNYMIKT